MTPLRSWIWHLGAVAGELDLRPGKNDPAQSGKAGGEFPYWVAVRGNDRAYISSVRDREVVVVDLSPKPVIAARIGVHGQPNKMALNRAQTLLYVSEDNSDTLAVIDTANNKILGELGVTAPADLLGELNGFSGSSPNSILLSRDERTAYLTLGGANAVAVVALDGQGRPSEVTGLIPTAWYPTSATLDRIRENPLRFEREEQSERPECRQLPRHRIERSRCARKMPRPEQIHSPAVCAPDCFRSRSFRYCRSSRTHRSRRHE